MAAVVVGVQSERTGSSWLGGCCGVTLYFDTGGQRSSFPGGGEKVANWGRFIQQSFSPFGNFQKRFWSGSIFVVVLEEF